MGLRWRSWARARCCAAGLAIGALAACGGGGGGDNPTPTNPGVDGSPYYPLAVGDRWRTVSAGTVSETRVSQTTSTSFGEGHVLSTVTGGGQAADQIRVKSADGVRSVPGAAADAITRAIGPVQILRFPLRVGTTHTAADVSANSFDFDGDGRFDAATVRIEVTVVGFENLTLASGSFSDVLRTRTVITQSATLSSNGQRVTFTTIGEDWYGRGIGPLRSVYVFDASTPAASTVETNLQAWRVGTNTSDAVAPTVIARTPEPGSAVRSASITIRFSEPMARSSVGTNGLRLQLAGAMVNGTTDWVDERTLRFSPVAASLPNGSYTVNLGDRPEDLLGNPVASDAAWSFTLDSSGPTLLSTSPAADTIDVPLGTVVTLDLDEPPLPATVTAQSIYLLQDGTVVPTTLQVNGNRVTLTPQATLARGLRYTLTITALLTDALGNAAPPTTASFTTDPGRFALPQSIGTGQVTSLGLDDVNGDGVADLLRTSDVGGAGYFVSVRRRAADGSFGANAWSTLSPQASSPICVAQFPSGAVLADLDADGRRDILYTGSCGMAWLNQGDSGPWAQRGILGPFVNTMLVLPAAAGGRPVIVHVGSPFGGGTPTPGVRVLRPNGGNGFQPTAELLYATTGGMTGLMAGDFNGDGRADFMLFVGEAGTGTNEANRPLMGLQRADGSFDMQLRTAAFDTSQSVRLIADVDGDGRAELVTASQDGLRLRVHRMAADGSLVAAGDITLAHRPEQIVVADLDGDGRRDLIYLHGTGTARSVAWARQRSDGSYQDTPLIEHARQPDLSAETALVVADLTGDGLADLLIGNTLFRQRPQASLASAASPTQSKSLWQALSRQRGP
jgi:hypothetical protein